MSDTKTREATARRCAQRLDLKVQKNRSRQEWAPNHGGYMLVDAYSNTVVASATHFPFSLSLSELEAELTERNAATICISAMLTAAAHV